MPLFRKLTGAGEFCSDAHRQSYQDEYNRLALSRLLQTHNGSEELPSSEPLPPPTHRLQKRAGTVLDLDVPLPSRRAHEPATRAVIPSASGEDRPVIAKRRAEFVPTRQAGSPGRIVALCNAEPCFAPAEPEPGAFNEIVRAPALGKRADGCVRITIPTRTGPAVAMRAGTPEWSPGGSEHTLPQSGAEAAVTRALAGAGSVRLPHTAATGEQPPHRTVALEPVGVKTEPAIPFSNGDTQAEACATGLVQRRVLPRLTAIALNFLAEVQEVQPCEPEATAPFRPHFDFADTVGTGFVAGLKLGGEQIRFELPAAPAGKSEPEPEEAPEQDSAAEDDAMLPREFVAAVQAMDASAKAWEDPPQESTEAAPEDEQGKTGAAPVCASLPLEPAPVPASTRQRLMQTFQAVGVAATMPGAPEFGILPVRPKFVVGRAPAAGAAHATAAVAVAEPEPQRRVAEAKAERSEAAELETIPIADSLDFLQDYEKRGQSVFAKFLGRIGSKKRGEV